MHEAHYNYGHRFDITGSGSKTRGDAMPWRLPWLAKHSALAALAVAVPMSFVGIGCDVPREPRTAEKFFHEVVVGEEGGKCRNFRGSQSSGTRSIGPVFVIATFAADDNVITAITRKWGLRFLKLSAPEEFQPGRMDHLAQMKQYLGADIERFYGGPILSNFHVHSGESAAQQAYADVTVIIGRDRRDACIFFLLRK